MTYEFGRGKRKRRYKIVNVEKGSRYNSEERRALLIEIIQQNPEIWHTDIIGIAQDIAGLPKRTIENELDRLSKAEIVFSTKWSDSPNATKSYQVKSMNLTFDEVTSKFSEVTNMALKRTQQVEKIFPKLNTTNKVFALVQLMGYLYSVSGIIDVVTDWIDISKAEKVLDTAFEKMWDLIDSKAEETQPMLTNILVAVVNQSVANFQTYMDKVTPKSG